MPKKNTSLYENNIKVTPKGKNLITRFDTDHSEEVLNPPTIPKRLAASLHKKDKSSFPSLTKNQRE